MFRCKPGAVAERDQPHLPSISGCSDILAAHRNLQGSDGGGRLYFESDRFTATVDGRARLDRK